MRWFVNFLTGCMSCGTGVWFIIEGVKLFLKSGGMGR